MFYILNHGGVNPTSFLIGVGVLLAAAIVGAVQGLMENHREAKAEKHR